MKTATIIKAIGNPNLALYAGEGYWYFVFDDSVQYETHTVYVFRLNQMTLEDWVAEGTSFIKRITEALS